MTEQLTEQPPGTGFEPDPGPPPPIRIPWAPVPKVNLLPIEVIESRRFRRTQGLLVAAVLVVLVLAGAGTFLAQRSVDDANDQLVDAQSRVTDLQTQQATYAAVPKVIAQVDAANAARQLALGNDVLWYRYLNELDGARPAGVDFTALTVVVTGSGASAAAGVNPISPAGLGSVSVEGLAKEYSEISSWLEALDGITGFESSTLTNATAEQDPDGSEDLTFSSGATVNSDGLSGRYEKKAG